MAESVKKYKIFLASPSDLLDERECINDVIAELNITYGTSNGIILELIKWESHSAPGITPINVQDVITKDVGNNYDLFIGLLWMKFGTPTSNASSGTEEEFILAYNRYKKYPDSLQILFYFKKSLPKSLDEINTSELEKVREFRSSLGEKGVFYWEFTTVSDLQSFLRVHIPKRIDELEKNNQNGEVVAQISIPKQKDNEFEELGIIDYQDNLESAFANSLEALYRIIESVTWVGLKINEKTAEMERMKKEKQDLGTKELRNYFQRTATIMNDFATRIDPEIPLFIKNFEIGANSITQLINLSEDSYSEDVISAYQSLTLLSDQITNAIDGMMGFLSAVIVLPRVEKELNKSRNNVESKLSNLIDQMNVSYSIVEELKKQFEGKYGF